MPFNLADDRFDKTGECWIWTAAKSSAGYGQTFQDGRVVYVHRVVYELAVGEIPQGYEVDHLCHNRACARPDHLEAVTPTENRRRQHEHYSHNRAKTHCPKGHPYSGSNLYMSGTNRKCRACRSEMDRARYLRRKAAA